MQNRIADKITTFAGSMLFVYIHLIWFSCWIGFGVEDYPFGLLTMIVSLEAIFLSTFVMISQNRADAKRQVIADQQWKTVQEEDKQNDELLDLSRQILSLTKEVRALAGPDGAARGVQEPERSDRQVHLSARLGRREEGQLRARRAEVDGGAAEHVEGMRIGPTTAAGVPSPGPT